MGLAPAQDLAPRLRGIHYSEIPVPTGREEEWRFTPLGRMADLHKVDVAAAQIDFIVAGDANVSVTENAFGDFAAADRVAALAAQLPEKTTEVQIAPNKTLAEPVLIVASPLATGAMGNLLLKVGDNTRATVILQQGGDLAQNLALQVDLGANAQLQLISIQDAHSSGTVLAQHSLNLGAYSTFDYRSATLGGGLVRVNTAVEFKGEGATVRLAGAFFTTNGQHHEHRLFVGHELPNCTSDVVYKGAIQGDDSHAVWIGDVLIRAAALGTKTYELNRNLLLTSGARADSVPNLEIETGQIQGAGHASATGRFDEEQLFYLMSRGIPETQAKRLVVRGFLSEIIDAIEVDELRASLWARIDSLLGAADPLFSEKTDD